MTEKELSDTLTEFAIKLIDNLKADNKRLREENDKLLEIIENLIKKIMKL